ncbi:hypothetical protein [Propionivibrio sp.]|uniref:hypothetical protein n=1 Tax=Propionivibrio sp. TaxID=2212460 RepID=UPI0025FD3AAC|nr:hypothetical protein [Propionivibrio sp.]MBK8746109.1 hypothetical protein [Propionivibrio sp.]
MSPFMESILAKITLEAEQASLHAMSHKKLIEEAEALQKILVDHGCRHAQPDWLRYCGAIFYDHSHDGTMARAIEQAGLKIASETIEPDSQGFGTNAHLLLEGYACRIWIHQPAVVPERSGFSPLRFRTEEVAA